MNKNPMAWIVGGLALVIVGPLLADYWAPQMGLIWNIQNTYMVIGRWPVRWAVIAGILAISWGIYLRLRNSN